MPRAGVAADADELVAFARARLAGYKLPRAIEFGGALPRTPSGKVLKRELRERFGARANSSEPGAGAPESARQAGPAGVGRT